MRAYELQNDEVSNDFSDSDDTVSDDDSINLDYDTDQASTDIAQEAFDDASDQLEKREPEELYQLADDAPTYIDEAREYEDDLNLARIGQPGACSRYGFLKSGAETISEELRDPGSEEKAKETQQKDRQKKRKSSSELLD